MLFQHTPILGQYDIKSTSTVPTRNVLDNMVLA